MKKRKIITICICLFVVIAALFLLGPSFVDPNHPQLPPPPPTTKNIAPHPTSPPPRIQPNHPIQPSHPVQPAHPIQPNHPIQPSHPLQQNHQTVPQPPPPPPQKELRSATQIPNRPLDETPKAQAGQKQGHAPYRKGEPIPPQVMQQQRQYAKDAEGTRELIRERNKHYNDWFSDRFYEEHRHRPYYYNDDYDSWQEPSWGGVSGWIQGDWDEPLYYDNGTAYAAPPADTIVPAEPPAGEDVPIQAPAESNWLPLGVFATGRTPKDASYSSMFIQLALGRDGKLVGTYYNSATDETFDITGQVDEYTQEATWKLSDNEQSPVMTTGLYNLTQDVAIVQVRFPSGTTQAWTLIRLKNR